MTPTCCRSPAGRGSRRGGRFAWSLICTRRGAVPRPAKLARPARLTLPQVKQRTGIIMAGEPACGAQIALWPRLLFPRSRPVACATSALDVLSTAAVGPRKHAGGSWSQPSTRRRGSSSGSVLRVAQVSSRAGRVSLGVPPAAPAACCALGPTFFQQRHPPPLCTQRRLAPTPIKPVFFNTTSPHARPGPRPLTLAPHVQLCICD
jgi:hypothetical protein